MKLRLARDAAIVHSTKFESAIVKIQQDKSDELEKEDGTVVSDLKMSTEFHANLDLVGMSFAERSLKSQETMLGPASNVFMDT